LVCRRAVALWLTAKIVEQLPIKSISPKNIGNRRIPLHPSCLQYVKGKVCVPYPDWLLIIIISKTT
jgi:hypothetical protein